MTLPHTTLQLDGPFMFLGAGLQVTLVALEKWVDSGEQRPRLPDDREAVFPIGSPVDFSRQAFQEIIWTVHRFGHESTRVVLDYARSRGAAAPG
jgi:hypothetical protein